MKTAENKVNLSKIEHVYPPDYLFNDTRTLLFLTGVPLSGKSTLAPLIAAHISHCSVQSMDFIRLIAQTIDSTKPEAERDPFVRYGSCDSYVFVGDGTYSPQNLIDGYNAYSKAVFSVLNGTIPKFELQGVRHMLFEGTQLTPKLVAPYLTNNNRLIIVTANPERLIQNRNVIYGNDEYLINKYSIEKLLILQEEILRQSREINSDKIIQIDNSDMYTMSVRKIISRLLFDNIIRHK